MLTSFNQVHRENPDIPQCRRKRTIVAEARLEIAEVAISPSQKLFGKPIGHP